MQLICQSCAMPMDDEQLKGTNKDGSKSDEYCSYCFPKGEFTSQMTMEEMVEVCIKPTIEAKVYADEQSARSAMLAFFPSLKRWQKQTKNFLGLASRNGKSNVGYSRELCVAVPTQARPTAVECGIFSEIETQSINQYLQLLISL